MFLNPNKYVHLTFTIIYELVPVYLHGHNTFFTFFTIAI